MNLIPFSYESYQIRVIEQQDETWFVLPDLCKALEIANPRNAAARLDEDQKGVHQIDSLGGAQNVTNVNESGLYDVILRSDKPQAKPFRRWITSEVLPAIRRTGSYSITNHFQRSDGSSHVAYTTRVQPSGLEFLARKFGLVLNHNVEEVAA